MFSSPSVRSFPSNENMDNVLQRKQGDINHLSRKPFIDRPVNSKTPDISRSAKGKLNVIKDTNGPFKKSPKTSLTCVTKISPKIEPIFEDLDAEEFIYSGNNNHDYLDWNYIDRERILRVLHCHSQIEDPHPSLTFSKPEIGLIDEDSFEIDPMFLALPEPFGCEDVGVIELPTCEDDDFDLPIRTL